MSVFQRAVKAQLKGRVAFCGPTGSGKTWTSLEWAEILAGDTGRIAFIDTERGSAALYADRFTFDVLAWEPPYEPGKLVDVIRAAVADGYDVVVVDSLTHFWSGEGGTLDVVDAAAQRAHGNSFAGWKVGSPAQREMVDALVGLDAHVIVTMRSKMEYVIEEDSRGKKVPRKIGMAPEQRAGVEYEFTVVGDIDLEHRVVVSKSRCDELADAVLQPGRAQEGAKTFAAWLEHGEPLASASDRKRVADAVRSVPEETRGVLAASLRERFGPADRMKASAVDDALKAIADHLLDEPEPDGPRGAGAPPEPAASEGGSVDGVGSAPSGEAPAPSTTANNVAGEAEDSVSAEQVEGPDPAASSATLAGTVEATEVSAAQGPPTGPSAAVPAENAGGSGGAARVSGDASDSPVDVVNDEGAQQIGRWCADAGIGDDRRPGFLYAFSEGAYHSAHEVPVDRLGALRAALGRVERGEWVLHVPAPGEGEPTFRVPGDSSESSASSEAPASLAWRAVLGEYKGIGQAKLLRRARDLAEELEVALPTSLDDIDPALNEPLKRWLEEQAAAA